MRKYSTLIFLLAVFVASCSSQTTARLSEFPLENGTTWVYSYKTYEQSASDPSQITEAIYQLTESVIDVNISSSYFVSHVKKDYQLIRADAEWVGGEFTAQQLEVWYVIQGNQVFSSRNYIDQENIQTNGLGLVYDFPLSLNKAWCLFASDTKVQNDPVNCDFAGKRQVIAKTSYETPNETFEDCYDMIDYFNTGNFYQTFCNGIGVVFVTFDHGGTRFGFEQALIQYSTGAP